tara:strand:+ start:6844 stop:7827 length:984 start_codon:yes stop_codon:yes gene_type:complete
MKILVVDDDPIALELLESCLLEAEFSDTAFVASSRHAEILIRDPSLHFDCFLLDISMPTKSGIELCSDIRSVDKYLNTPVLMITSLKNSNSIQRAFAKGATDYITKPFEFSEVIARIKFAHRVVLERKAALESCLQTGSRRANYSRSSPNAIRRKINAKINNDNIQFGNTTLLQISVLENYIQKMTDTENCCVDVIAIKIENIDQLYGELSVDDFNALVETFTGAVRTYSTQHQVFFSYIGDGVFVCVGDQVKFGPPSVAEKGIISYLPPVKGVTPKLNHRAISISVCEPIRLLRSSGPNFGRLMKVAMARLEARRSQKAKVLLTVN